MCLFQTPGIAEEKWWSHLIEEEIIEGGVAGGVNMMGRVAVG